MCTHINYANIKTNYEQVSYVKQHLLLTDIFFFFFFYWRHNPLWVLAFSVILFHSVLCLLNFLHPLIPIDWISSSVSSIHLFLGLPLILLPVGFHSNTLLGILFSSIRITCPSQAILLLFINAHGYILLFPNTTPSTR